MKTLIFTQPDDTHAVMVQLALEKVGHQVTLLCGADQPSKLAHSVWVNSNQSRWYRSDQPKPLVLNHYDVIWLRRLQRPFLPRHHVHPQDYDFSNRENQLFFDGLTVLMEKQAWWVNAPDAVRRANAKLYQLQLAKAVGLTIPPTLCSNSPQDIRAFIKKHQQVGVIYKPLCSSFWFEEKGVKAIYTSQVSASQLPHDEVLKLTPGIFQPQIKKKYELRIICFGAHCVAVKLDSQQHDCGRIDWRAMPDGNLDMTPYVLPTTLIYRLRMLMRTLGIVFGSIDMIVTPEGEYVFLEVNEQGQFLWIEEQVPEIPLLDCFIQFMLSRSFYFTWEAKNKRHRLSDYRLATQAKIGVQLETHVDVKTRRAECVMGAC